MIHAFKISDKHYIFDVESNNLFGVDELLFCVVKNLDLSNYSTQEIQEAKAELW